MSILTALGANKWLAYIALGLILLSGVSILFLKIRNGGRDQERLAQAEQQLKRARQNAEIRIAVARADTDSARSVLKRKYSQ